jgi:uncharacterized membrane protein YbhN (UPF0104 family)
VREQLRIRPVVLSAVAMGIAAIAVLVLARTTGVDQMGRVFNHFEPAWIGLIAGAELLAYPAYMLAYRSIAQVHGHAPLAEHSAKVRVLALGTLEWAVLAPTTAVVAIVLLVQHADMMPSLLWPWAIAVPLGFGFGLWASTPGRVRWLGRFTQRAARTLCRTLEGVGVLRTLLSQPRRYAPAWLGTALYWAADITAFYGGLRTFGLHPGFGKVIIAYSTGYAATRRSLPLGGAGITEALMTYSLYWVRQPLAPALAAVVAYRVFNFLLASTPGLIAHRQLQPLLRRARAGTQGPPSRS